MIRFAPPSIQVEVARREIGPIDYKIEPRDFANVREIGVGLLGEDRHRAAGESETSAEPSARSKLAWTRFACAAFTATTLSGKGTARR